MLQLKAEANACVARYKYEWGKILRSVKAEVYYILIRCVLYVHK